MPKCTPPAHPREWASRRLFWAALGLAFSGVAVKAYYLGRFPVADLTESGHYLRSLAAISCVDVLFAVGLWIAARAACRLISSRTAGLSAAFVLLGALSALYLVASVVFFGVFGGFLTYPLLELVGSVRMVRSSVSALLTARVLVLLLLAPLGYAGLVEALTRVGPVGHAASRRTRTVLAAAVVASWTLLGWYGFSLEWATRRDWRIAGNPEWVLVSSWWQAMTGGPLVRMAEPFPAADLSDFESFGHRSASRVALLPPHRSVPVRQLRGKTVRRPLSVVLVVLESVAARWTGLSGGAYDTTPNLKTEAARSLVFDNFYAHIGRSSNSLAAMLMSIYPKIGFRDMTEEYPRLPGTSLAALFQDRGYRTAFMMPSDLGWARWNSFFEGRGFSDLRDVSNLPCSTPPISSWGIEDRCLVDAMVQWLDQDPGRPFFLMGWAHQMHHPYEPSPGIPQLNLLREQTPDDYDLSRYLNVLHETDRQLERLFEAVRRAGLDQDTLIVVVGDHGQAFGYPHDSYIQGRTVYEEDVHIPLMLWLPRLYHSAMHAPAIGSHVDLAPTIADLAGVAPAADWQGRSLFDTGRSSRAYFYVAEDRFTLGMREGSWKYIFSLREGSEELYNLDHDPIEQHNLAATEPERCARMRQRLAAWAEANRRQYAGTQGIGT